MLRVRVDINLVNLIDTHVVRVAGGTDPDDLNTYCLPDGRRLKHRYGDGAASLAIKILCRTQEPQ